MRSDVKSMRGSMVVSVKWSRVCIDMRLFDVYLLNKSFSERRWLSLRDDRENPQRRAMLNEVGICFFVILKKLPNARIWTYVNIVDTFSRTFFMQPS